MKYTIPYDDKITLPNIKKIETIGINADNLYYDTKELTGEVIITGDYLLDDSKDIMEFKHDIPVSFLIDDDKVSPQINISNFKYELIPGRGIEVMFDLDVILTEIVEDEEKIVPREAKEITLEETTKNLEELDEVSKEKKPKKKTRQKTEEEDIKEFQDKIDENLDAVLNKRSKTEKKKVVEEPEIVEEVKEEIKPRTEVIEEPEIVEDDIPSTEVIEEKYVEDIIEDEIFSTTLSPTLSSFDTSFISRENDKYTTYKIILIEENEDVDQVLESRNLSKALICNEYEFDNKKIVLKIENDKH